MNKKPKKYWVIKIIDGCKEIYTRKFPMNLSESEIKIILQRLACKDLSYDEIIASSVRRPQKIEFLEVKSGKRNVGDRMLYYIDATYCYTASVCSEDDLLNRQGID